MREVALILWAVYGMIFCLNVGIYFIANGLGMSELVDRSIDFTELNQTLVERGDSFESDPFNTLFIFGDFNFGADEFWSLLSGAYFTNTMDNLGMASYLTFPLQVTIFGFLLIGGVVYYISGR